MPTNEATPPKDAASQHARAFGELMRQTNAFRLSQAIHVAATLGIADLLADGPRSADHLARATDAHGPSLYRLLRALAAEGIFEETPDRHFALTLKAELLRDDAPLSIRDWCIFIGRPNEWQGWGNMLYSVKTGKSGRENAQGMSTWEFRERHPEEGAVFDRAMTEMTRALSPAVVAAYDWGRFGVIADIAGGHGAQLADILATFPKTRGVLFDQPHVVDGAYATLQAAGVADRCQIVGGSFFENVPAADAYILKNILHDWYDEDCVRILRTIRDAASENARLLVIEQLIGAPNKGAAGKSLDLGMLVGAGGMERTREEWEALLADGGWRFLDAHPAAPNHVMESAPA